MRSEALCHRLLLTLSLPVLLLTPSLVPAQVPAPPVPVDAAGQHTEEKQPFWPAWHKFVSDITESANNPDPWESFNRRVFAFNDWADRWFLKPVAKGYQWITPDVVETGIGNVFSNLLDITTVVNDLMQFKFTQAASDTGRFVVNSTVGMVGIFDVATPLGLAKHNEDFGQTLGYWGVGSGPYLVMPLLGSYTLRSGTGAIIESSSTDFLEYVDHSRTRNQMWSVRLVDRRADLLKAEELVTGDRYSFVRDAYLQRREFLTNDGVVEDNFGEEDYEEEWDDAIWEE